MDNKKKLVIGGVILLVVLVFAGLVFSGVFGKNEPVDDEPTTQEDIADNYMVTNQYTNDITASAENNLPYLETDIENLFYTASTDGEIKFYTFADNKFTETEADGTYDVTVTMSEQELKATVTYIEKDGVISGYGLYKGATDGFDLYPYAFFRLTNYGSNSSSYMLLVDVTEDDFYSNSKIYEEPFIFKPGSSSSTKMLSEASRTVGINGTKRSDYFIFNDSVIEASGSNQLFFSGRQYSEADERVDLFRSGGSGNNVDNIRLVTDVLGYWVKNVDGAIMYITCDENGNIAVMKYDTDSKESEAVKTFEGSKREDVLVSGDYLYLADKNTVYALTEDKEVKLNYAGVADFRADMFVCNGESFIVRGYSEKLFAVMIQASLENGAVIKSFTNEFFREIVNPVNVNGNTMFTVQENGKFSYYIF